MPEWRKAALAEKLFERPDADDERTVLNTCMPVVDAVLRSGSPASLDFTLHDDQHSYRVAETAYILADVAADHLSNYELSLLLLASYCHDSGMSPQRSRIKSLYSWLISANASCIEAGERELFQQWLDTNRNGLTAPIETTAMTKDGIAVVDDAISYYARSRHNDWSEDFIREELGVLTVSLYPGWIEDLVLLCKSHHEGLLELRKDKFSLKYVGSPAQPVNLRYLASLLRVADVLEFAPERTPAVVLKNRDIAPKSRIFWYKDHSIAFRIDNSEKKLIFSARTTNATLHKAVLETKEWVDAELSLVANLEQEKLLNTGVVSESIRANYSWVWPSRLATDIREASGSFTYIDGSFRPDTQKILSLLSGTSLYENRLAAIRELVQNSLDAVREQIAYSRLLLSDPLDNRTVNSLAELHYVTLTIVADGSRISLSCEDNGTGMTRAIIERHMLVSGSGTRGESRRLERAAHEAGFSVERTGRFGIGVLSYFMLADSVTFVTRRSQEAGDADSSAWNFHIHGLDGFGELKAGSRSSRGTIVTLQMLQSVVEGDAEAFCERDESYVLETFRWLPCRLNIRREIGKVSVKTFGPGWTHSPLDESANTIRRLIPRNPVAKGLLTKEDFVRLAAESVELGDLAEKAKNSLFWSDAQNASFSNGAGIMRGSIPYFVINGQPSTIFSRSMNDNLEFIWQEKDVTAPKLPSVSSLHGIKVESLSNINDCLLDIDLRSNFAIKADRTKIIGSLDLSMRKKVRSFRAKLWKDFLSQNQTSTFHEINVAHAKLPFKAASEMIRDTPAWFMREFGSDVSRCATITKPFIAVGRFSFYEWANYHMKTAQISEEAIPVGGDSSESYTSLDQLYAGGRLIVQDQAGSRMPMLGLAWEGPHELIKIDGTIGRSVARFPAALADFACARLPHSFIFNKEHAFTTLASSFALPVSSRPTLDQITAALEEALRSSHQAILFIVSALGWELKTWQWLQENKNKDFRLLLDLAGLSGLTIMTLDSRDYTNNRINVSVSNAASLEHNIIADLPKLDACDTFSVVSRDGPR